MTSKMFSLALAGSAVLGLSVSAFAGANKPASLLVYPCYDNSRSTETLITVTNTSTTVSGTASADNVQVEFVYINGANCLETNRTRTLTPGDTLTVLASADNPNSNAGYVYVFAKRNGAAISFNHLIGTSITLSGSDTRDFELDPIAFLALGADNATTDAAPADGRRDLNGTEYEQAPGELAFPRFVGQGNGAESRLILINLVGARFNAVLDFLVYNDNEEVFSAQKTIDCWDRVLLSDINGVFNNDFLYNNTNHNVNEIAGISFNEVGWFSVQGTVANSSNDVVLNPAILAALVESVHGDGGGMLPWQLGSGRNGELLNLSIQSDL
ncbi:MAG: hypothetical protein HZA53_02840 [Planctomycetes bacterium]|nr:hypothetical protein [Planctomycetota bacterium]